FRTALRSMDWPPDRAGRGEPAVRRATPDGQRSDRLGGASKSGGPPRMSSRPVPAFATATSLYGRRPEDPGASRHAGWEITPHRGDECPFPPAKQAHRVLRRDLAWRTLTLTPGLGLGLSLAARYREAKRSLQVRRADHLNPASPR